MRPSLLKTLNHNTQECHKHSLSSYTKHVKMEHFFITRSLAISRGFPEGSALSFQMRSFLAVSPRFWRPSRSKPLLHFFRCYARETLARLSQQTMTIFSCWATEDSIATHRRILVSDMQRSVSISTNWKKGETHAKTSVCATLRVYPLFPDSTHLFNIICPSFVWRIALPYEKNHQQLRRSKLSIPF